MKIFIKKKTCNYSKYISHNSLKYGITFAILINVLNKMYIIYITSYSEYHSIKQEKKKNQLVRGLWYEV